MELTADNLREELQRQRKSREQIILGLGRVEGVIMLLEQQIEHLERPAPESQPAVSRAEPKPESVNGSQGEEEKEPRKESAA